MISFGSNFPAYAPSADAYACGGMWRRPVLGYVAEEESWTQHQASERRLVKRS